MVHNETGNIWTHLLGLIYYISVLYRWCRSHALFDPLEPKAPHDLMHILVEFDSFTVVTYMASGLLCMFSSSCFHTFVCKGHHAHDCCLRFDLSGVATHIALSFLCGIHFAFRCYPVCQTVYLIASAVMSFFLIASPHLRFMQRPKNPWRLRVFAGAGICGAIPMFHFLVVGTPEFIRRAWFPCAGMAGSYLFGVFIFLNKIPEKWAPGTFDLIGQSHQLWHVCVLAGSYIWLCGLIDWYHFVHSPAGQCEGE
uniref:Uncharacterized protein n=1 Tax=Chromera velia CCMP2878 TaxID=1169474 RepID=A0A0G4GRN9_9ALVE|eukprot:Cvel_5111.t1-p1 / transcript=Cvel_5111.t1 / gene=Cvel_5111 / organism=Chromera_velia_CCMP2878 / gene_product=Adiponectin receptor protein 2, putative / transcript_product=Adiponectin receptor protein 2, putative / location=Cvel_scaffold233:103837-105817(+) / protein_length=252 / sequence_SO=supercontig / SO=protein_coding / is_pseudo=false